MYFDYNLNNLADYHSETFNSYQIQINVNRVLRAQFNLIILLFKLEFSINVLFKYC